RGALRSGRVSSTVSPITSATSPSAPPSTMPTPAAVRPCGARRPPAQGTGRRPPACIADAARIASRCVARRLGRGLAQPLHLEERPRGVATIHGPALQAELPHDARELHGKPLAPAD